jgi:outer membrane protein assembly factor BamB
MKGNVMRSRLFATIFATALAVALSACSTLDAINPFSSSKKVKLAELAPLPANADLTALWQASLGTAGENVFTPAVVGERVYAADHSGNLARFDAGRQVWRIAVGQAISGGVGADAKLVVVGTAKGEVLVFNAETGAAAWKARVSSEVLSAPVVGDGSVFVRSGDARVTAFDAADGKRRWVYQRSTPTLTLRSTVGLTLMSGRGVVAGFPGGKLVAIAGNNGAALWEGTVALPKGSTELERVADITSSPVIDGRDVCAAAFQGRVACFELASGNALWTRELSSSAGIDMDSKYVYVSDDKGAVHALDRSNGASVWKQDKLANRGLSRPLALGNKIAVADALGFVHLLRREDGAFAARAGSDGSAIVAEPQRLKDNSGLAVQTKNGSVFALGVH